MSAAQSSRRLTQALALAAAALMLLWVTCLALMGHAVAETAVENDDGDDDVDTPRLQPLVLLGLLTVPTVLAAWSRRVVQGRSRDDALDTGTQLLIVGWASLTAMLSVRLASATHFGGSMLGWDFGPKAGSGVHSLAFEWELSSFGHAVQGWLVFFAFPAWGRLRCCCRGHRHRASALLLCQLLSLLTPMYPVYNLCKRAALSPQTTFASSSFSNHAMEWAYGFALGLATGWYFESLLLTFALPAPGAADEGEAAATAQAAGSGSAGRIQPLREGARTQLQRCFPSGPGSGSSSPSRGSAATVCCAPAEMDLGTGPEAGLARSLLPRWVVLGRVCGSVLLLGAVSSAAPLYWFSWSAAPAVTTAGSNDSSGYNLGNVSAGGTSAAGHDGSASASSLAVEAAYDGAPIQRVLLVIAAGAWSCVFGPHSTRSHSLRLGCPCAAAPNDLASSPLQL
jgi:hypothetical protein